MDWEKEHWVESLEKDMDNSLLTQVLCRPVKREFT